ncbi:ABC-type transport system [Zymobacter palmae]|uniref:ABC-type transport system n=1 Tax=Zymobacter palmae TaxID=33074 RepID=A0A348HFS6_9GAMM|nr:ABC-type transport system [Zymobacter palmae]
MVFLRQRCQRQADAFLRQPHLLQRPFNRNRVSFDAHRVVQRHQARINLMRAFAITGQRSFTQRMHGVRRHVGRDRNNTVTTGQHEITGRRVITRVQREIATLEHVEQFLITLQITCSFLQTDDIIELGQAEDSVVEQVDARACRYVVHDDRQTDFSDGFEVLVQPFLRRTVVVRRDRQAAIRTRFLGPARQIDGFPGSVGARARDDRYSTVHFVNDRTNNVKVLFHGHGGGLTGGSCRDDTVSAIFQMEIYQTTQSRPVYVAIGHHGGRQCNDTTCDHSKSSLSCPACTTGLLSFSLSYRFSIARRRKPCHQWAQRRRLRLSSTSGILIRMVLIRQVAVQAGEARPSHPDKRYQMK